MWCECPAKIAVVLWDNRQKEAKNAIKSLKNRVVPQKQAIFCGTILFEDVNCPGFRVGLLYLVINLNFRLKALTKNHGILCQCARFLVVFDDFSAGVHCHWTCNHISDSTEDTSDESDWDCSTYDCPIPERAPRVMAHLDEKTPISLSITQVSHRRGYSWEEQHWVIGPAKDPSPRHPPDT